MVLVNFVEFVVFKILFDLVSMQNLLNANTDDINKIRKTALPDLIHFQCTFKISYWFYLIFGSLD